MDTWNGNVCVQEKGARELRRWKRIHIARQKCQALGWVTHPAYLILSRDILFYEGKQFAKGCNQLSGRIRNCQIPSVLDLSLMAHHVRREDRTRKQT